MWYDSFAVPIKKYNILFFRVVDTFYEWLQRILLTEEALNLNYLQIHIKQFK